MNRPNLIREISRLHPPLHTALVEGSRSYSYGELFTAAAAIAARLGPLLPAGRSARLGLQCPNGSAYIVLALAILLADACLVPLAEELTEDERLEIARVTCLDGVISVHALPWLHHPGTPLDAAASYHPLPPAVPSFPEDEFQSLHPAFIRFSSGTTGQSKGVVLSHASLRARLLAANDGLRLEPSDRVLWMLPMAHHFAVSIVLYLFRGATTLLVPPGSSPGDILDLAGNQRATVVYGAPFHFALLAAAPGNHSWPSLRLAVSTASRLTLPTAEAFSRRFHQSLVQGLGVIEAGLPILNLHHARSHPEALGIPLPAYTVRLLDPSGRPVPDGTPGELHLAGPGLLDAYLHPWNPSPLTPSGAFNSGDLVCRDPATGLLFHVGRSKSVINVAGMKVFPEEVEALLDSHPGVLRSHVYPVPHRTSGEIPVADLIPADPSRPPSSLDLRQFLRTRLSAFKIPARFSIVSRLPLTPSGKIRRDLHPEG